MTDKLGLRMKELYEVRSQTYLNRRTYTIIRVDGRSFKNYTKKLVKPFDDGLIEDMNLTAAYLCKSIQGARFAYVASDEISVLLTDFETLTTDAWFDYNVQKCVSISASLASTKFNQLRLIRECSIEDSMKSKVLTKEIISNQKLAEFDSRIFQIPQSEEVRNYFIWRQQDTVRNSISSVAQFLYSSEELKGKNSSEQQEMCFQKGINWNDYSPKYKRGRIVVKEEYDIDGLDKKGNPIKALRTRWVAKELPTITQDRDFLTLKIPNFGNN